MLKRYLNRLMELFSYSTKDALQIKIMRGKEKYLIKPENFDEFTFQSTDQLIIIPGNKSSQLLKTPDNHRHILIKEGKAIRIPTEMTLKPYKGYLIPEHLCILTGAGTETLETIGKSHINSYQKHMGLWPEMTFFEIGCGLGRDAFQILSILNNKGKYIGIDVTRDSIVWLQKNITSRHPNFTFHHFDAKHELYNPLGSKTSFDFRFPVEDHSVDRIAVGSVFTHLFEDEVVHYMKEIKRALKPNGLAYATFFLYAEDAIAASRQKSATSFNLRFEHSYGDGCFVNDPTYKTGAVAYTQEAILRMINKSELKLSKPLIRGYWSGLFTNSDDGQDVAILGAS